MLASRSHWSLGFWIGLGKKIRTRWAAHTTVSPSRCNWLGQRERKNQYNLGLVPLQNCRAPAIRLRGSTPVLSSRFTPEASVVPVPPRGGQKLDLADRGS